jgi:hypothetical protein
VSLVTLRFACNTALNFSYTPNCMPHLSDDIIAYWTMLRDGICKEKSSADIVQSGSRDNPVVPGNTPTQ